MCGIHFIFDKKNCLQHDNIGEKIIQKMTFATTYRGQNIDSFRKIEIKTENTQNQTLYFGHNLLPVSDFLPQPFTLQENILIFNGQIYNHLDIRHKIKNDTYKTQSDTETLAYFLKELSQNNHQNIDFLQKSHHSLNGMYAFVYYDHTHQKIVVARDKNGIKPLFYAENNDFLIISSEIKAILATELFEKNINLSQISHFLTFKYAQSPHTFYENIFEVKESFILNLESNQKTFFQADFQKNPLQIPSIKIQNTKIIHDLDEILHNAVARQLVANRNVGVFASGGVDSTLLLAYCQELGYKTTAFSAVNTQKEQHFGTLDYHFAKKSAFQYGANYEEMLLTSDILEDLEAYIHALDQPIADGAGLLTYHLAKKASITHQVLLSGAGADEIFAGYNRHQAFYFYQKYKLKYFFWLKNIVNYTLNNKISGHFLNTFFRKKIRLLNKAFDNIFWENTPTFLGFTRLNVPLNGDFFNHFCDFLEKGNFEEKFEINSLKDALKYDTDNFLRQDVLAITDKMTMQHTVEMRVPYLDNTIQDFVSQFPAGFLLKNGKKWLLKEVLIRKNGKIYTQRAKEGFGMPIGLWLQLPKYRFYIDFLKNLPEILYEFIDKKAFNQCIDLHLQNKLDFGAEMWAVLTLGLWIYTSESIFRIF